MAQTPPPVRFTLSLGDQHVGDVVASLTPDGYRLDTRVGGSVQSMTVRDAMFAHWRHAGRTIYAQRGIAADPDRDVLIGVMDSPELARMVVHVHNQGI